MISGSDLIRSSIRDVPDFPKPGILFRDITPLLASPEAFTEAIDQLAERYRSRPIDQVMAVEARGFLLGAPLALRLNLPLQVVRKPGKLPAATEQIEYSLEYGTNTLQIHRDALRQDDRVLIVDDLLATGGTVAAAVKLTEQQGAKVVECAFLIELTDLGGRAKLGADAFALLQM